MQTTSIFLTGCSQDVSFIQDIVCAYKQTYSDSVYILNRYTVYTKYIFRIFFDFARDQRASLFPVDLYLNPKRIVLLLIKTILEFKNMADKTIAIIVIDKIMSYELKKLLEFNLQMF